jgi:hypothetical protein
LQPVIHLSQKTGSEGHRQHFAGQLDLVPDLDPGGIFEDLKIRYLILDAEHLGFETLLSKKNMTDLVFHDPSVADADRD